MPGSYSYVDPRQQVRTVDYVADKQGFHPILSDVPPEHPADTESSEAVVAAAAKHTQLFRVIAEQHARIAAEREELQLEEERQHLQELEHEHILTAIAKTKAMIAKIAPRNFMFCGVDQLNTVCSRHGTAFILNQQEVRKLPICPQCNPDYSGMSVRAHRVYVDDVHERLLQTIIDDWSVYVPLIVSRPLYDPPSVFGRASTLMYFCRESAPTGCM
ncbi:putative cuticle protein [Operophtera brumata]|uniref:Putative cuticle protein n=1 Tax=Operophtera brumata TaxID=104452 RepID=A0A0L7KSV9_OPEBR|nr:putative cuticle protein [Operophtera brumata]